MAYTLSNIVSSAPANSSVGYNSSWLKVNNNANRDLFAQASYITNFDDLSISLTTPDINIGNIRIADPTSNMQADVVTVTPGSGALRVLTQDLECSEDDVTIGDREGNYAAVNETLSALNVYITNPNNEPYSFTLCETRTEGNPSFVSKQILLHNPTDIDTEVILTLTSGLSCAIPVYKAPTNNQIILNLAVSGVNNYNGCVINFFG